MTLFAQAAGAVLLALVLCLCLEKQGKDMAVLLTMAVCIMVMAASISYIKPVMDFLSQLQEMGNLSNSMVSTLFKIVGIGLLSEIVSMICADAGRTSLGKSLQILAGGVILWLSIPIFTLLLELIRGILGDL